MTGNILRGLVSGMVLAVMTGSLAFAHEEHGAGGGSTAVTGEVVDVFCYMSHGQKGLGPDHAGCAKKCILGGLPVAIRSDGQLYLATMSDHTAANQKLAEFAGKDVTVHGKVTEQDGMKFISIEHIEGH